MLSTLYALGHAAIVLLLGLIAVLVGVALPDWLDVVMGKLIGASLVFLGIYAVYGLVRSDNPALESRWMLVMTALRHLHRGRAIEIEHDHPHVHSGTHAHRHRHEVQTEEAAVGARRLPVAGTVVQHRHRHRHAGVMPHDPFPHYGGLTAIGIGMLHGVGAETPTQVMLFLTAAGVQARWLGTLVLFAFVVGLLLSNSALAALGGLALRGHRARIAQRMLLLAAATFSVGLGIALLISD